MLMPNLFVVLFAPLYPNRGSAQGAQASNKIAGCNIGGGLSPMGRTM